MSQQKAANIIQGRYYRFTILTDRLIRMEYSGTGVFTDQKTQVVVNRDFPAAVFETEETEMRLRIETAALCLEYEKQAFSPESLRISFRGPYAKYSSGWRYGDIPRDLGGTARTLDGADGKIPLDHGLLSTRGWSILDDSRSLILTENGGVAQREDPEAIDMYFFGYGRDYLDCLADFYRLTGPVPLLPRFALGNWWSRYYRYSEESYLRLMDRFRREEIPLTVAVIDMDWHLTKIDPKYGSGWTGYTWNRELFPEPERFLAALHERGLKTTLNVHPADGVRAFEDAYPAFAAYMGVDTAREEPVKFAPGDERFRRGYFDYVHHPLEEQGVDFWWIDWQQGTRSGVKGLDPLWILNHSHYLDSRKRHGRGLIFSRYGGPGSHRYPVGFSGDTVISWKSLEFQPYFTATASNVGYGWWSHDIGGHMRGVRDDELAVRWLQLGAFSPILRLHSSNETFNGKEPWRYNRIAEEAMKAFLRLRHRMIPYLDTMNLRASRNGLPLVWPLYYRYPETPQAYRYPNEYYFGSELLVCPVTAPADRQSNRAACCGWLPEGLWVDLFTGLLYDGNREMDFYRGIESLPVFLKGGGILVLDGRLTGNKTDLPPVLEIAVNAAAGGSFTLWEDDGTEADYREEAWASTEMRIECGESTVFTVEPPSGNLRILPEKRGYILRVYGLAQGDEPEISADGEVLAGCVCEYDGEGGIWSLTLPEIRTGSRICVCLPKARLHDNQRLERIFSYLDRTQTDFGTKSDIYQIAEKAEQGVPLAYVLAELQRLDVKKEILGPVMEILAARADVR